MIKKTVIVTGGAGFVGTNIVRKLIKEKYEVHVFVRQGSSLWRLEDVYKNIVIHEDILGKPELLKLLMKKISPFAVYHLAAYGSYPTQQDTQRMIDVNIKGTNNLLESLKDVNYKQLIIAGSSSEYGIKEKPMKETDLLTPNNFYAATKACQTHLSLGFAKSFHKPLLVFRFFNVYGYYEEKGRLVRSVIESVISNKPILLATGREARDLIFVEDIADAFLSVTKSPKQFEGEIFNIGTGVQTTIKKLAENVIKISGRKVPIVLNAYPGRVWDSYHWVADMKKTNKLLNWKPKYALEEGLKKTINWYKRYEKT